MHSSTDSWFRHVRATGSLLVVSRTWPAVGDWEACGDCFYARELLHEMSWEEMDLETKRW
jgi:hypothetical protein